MVGFVLKLNLELLMEIAEKVRFKVQSLIDSGKAGKIVGVGVGGDKTRYVDWVAEKTIFEMLKTNKISCVVVSEESGVKKILGGNQNTYLIVDGLDGTYNALRKIPFYAISLAVADKPKLSAVHTSLVANLSMEKMIFTAEKGLGAKLNGKPIKPSKTNNIEEALITLNPSTNKKILEKVSGILCKAQHIRHYGAISLEICYVASGRLDAAIDLRGKLRVTDLAASYHIIREAGGFIVREDGNMLDSLSDNPQRRVSFLAVGNKKLLNKLLILLKNS